VAGHRATQLVAAGLLGLVLGGGAVALFDHGDGPGHGQGGYSQYDSRGGHGPGVPGGGNPGRFER
jgi:hypothetical protein